MPTSSSPRCARRSAGTGRSREYVPAGVMTERGIETRVFEHGEQVAQHAAAFIATEFREAVGDRGRFLLAVSGGTTPWRMLEILAGEDLPWSRLHLFQVDERIAPAGDDARNLSRLMTGFVGRIDLPSDQMHAMPVEAEDLDAAAYQYAKTLREIAGTPPVLDLVQLGLGSDGHTASLIPGDATLDSSDEVALTGPYEGTRRMTLTFPAIDRARRILWVVTGARKRDALSRLLRADRSIPAGRVSSRQAVVFADQSALG